MNESQRHRIPDWVILTAVILITTLLMIIWGRWRPTGMELRGIDVAGHYAWLRSPLIDGDFEFGNDYQGIIEAHLWELHRDPIPETGHHANPFPIGCALALLPLVGITHLALTLTPLGNHWPADGFSMPYALAAHWSLWLWAAIGLLLTHAWLRRHWPRGIAMWAVLLTWLATNAVHYQFPIVLNNHSIALTGMPFFLLSWDRWQERPALGRAFMAAVACGALFLIRWQLALWPVVLWLSLFVKRRDESQGRPDLGVTLWVVPAIALAIATPQFIAWRIIYGQWLLVPQGESYIQWTRPMIVPLLFSLHRGWITWTPMVAMGLAGLMLGLRGHRRFAACALIGILLQLYMSSVVDWHGSFGFSARRMAHATPLLAWGVANVLAMASRGDARRLRLMGMCLSLFVVWNALFLFQHYHHLIPYHRPLTWHEWITDKFHIASSLQRRRAVRNAEGWVQEASAARHRGDPRATAAALENASWMARHARELDPHHEDVYLVSALVALERGDRAAALAEYQACFDDIGVDRSQILMSMGVAHLYGGRVDLAAEFAQRSLNERPDYLRAQRLLEDARDGVRDDNHAPFFF